MRPAVWMLEEHNRYNIVMHGVDIQHIVYILWFLTWNSKELYVMVWYFHMHSKCSCEYLQQCSPFIQYITLYIWLIGCTCYMGFSAAAHYIARHNFHYSWFQIWYVYNQQNHAKPTIYMQYLIYIIMHNVHTNLHIHRPILGKHTGKHIEYIHYSDTHR